MSATAAIVNLQTECTKDCTTYINELGNACQMYDDIFCNGAANNPKPASGLFPAYSLQTAFCFPTDCGEAYAAALTDYIKFEICGPLYGSPDCKFTLSCWYPPSGSWLWPVLGSVLGLILLAAVALFTWAKCEERRRRRAGGGGADAGGAPRDASNRRSSVGSDLDADTNELLMHADEERL